MTAKPIVFTMKRKHRMSVESACGRADTIH